MNTYRIERGYYMADRYFHGWRIDVQNKKTLNWETLFKCKNVNQIPDCVSKLYDHDNTIFYCGYGYTIEEALKKLGL